MKSNLLVVVLSLSTVGALAAPSEDANSLSRAGRTPERKVILLAKKDGDQKQATGDEETQDKGNGKGKAKGKAKGHYKNQGESANGSSQASSSTAASEKPATPAPAPSAAPAASTPAVPVKAKESVSSAPALSTKELKAELDKRVRRVNTLDNNAQAAKAGLDAIAKETGVPVSTLQAQVKQYKAGSAGLLVANELAKATGKPAATFLKQRQQQSRDWDRIAAENKFDLSTVFPKLDQVQASMEAAQKTKKR